MELLDSEILKMARDAQVKIEESGIGLIEVDVNDPNTLSAIERIFGEKRKTITFEMFKDSYKKLIRCGIIKGYNIA